MPSLASRAAAGKASPSRSVAGNYEFFLVTIAVLLTAVLPGIAKYQGSDEGGTSGANEILWGLMYVVAAVRVYALRATAAPLFRRSLGLWAFVGLMLVTTIWSVDATITFKNAIELIGTSLVGLYIVTRFTIQQFLSILGIAFAVIGVLSIGLIFGAPAHGRMDWGAGAWSGIYQEKNNLAAAAALAIISQIILLSATRGRRRSIVVGGLIFFCILLVGAQSATAFVDTVVVLLVPFVVWGCRTRRYRMLTRGLIVVGVIGVVIAAIASGGSTDALLGLMGRQTNLTGRTDFWPYLQQAIADRPWLGYGYNAFFRSPIGAEYLASYVIEAGGWTPYHAHNSFLQISLEGGYVGLWALLALLARALWRGAAFIGREAASVAVWPFAIFLYLLLGSFTETYLARCNTMEWILFTAAYLYPMRGIAARSKNSPIRPRAVPRAAQLAQKQPEVRPEALR